MPARTRVWMQGFQLAWGSSASCLSPADSEEEALLSWSRGRMPSGRLQKDLSHPGSFSLQSVLTCEGTRRNTAGLSPPATQKGRPPCFQLLTSFLVIGASDSGNKPSVTVSGLPQHPLQRAGRPSTRGDLPPVPQPEPAPLGPASTMVPSRKQPKKPE